MKHTTRAVIEFSLLALIVIAASCSRSNNLLEGRVEALVGDHVVVVTDCYRTSVSPPQRLDNPSAGHSTYRFAPCRDAVIELQGAEVVVNGTSYGEVKPKDTITVDHGRVLINERVATATATLRGSDATEPNSAPP